MVLALSTDVLSKLWPRALPGMIAGVSSDSSSLAKYGIVTLPDLIDFMAECSEETGGMTRVVESGAYTAERAHEVWPSLFPTAASAVLFVANDRLLFDKTYGGRLGNRPGTDDGYNFRGRGMIQITGREWYAKIAEETGLNLIVNPDIAASPADTLECAAAYWKLARVSALANAGNFIAEVRRINGGAVNMAARLQWRAECEKILTPQAVTVKAVADASPVAAKLMQGAKPVTETPTPPPAPPAAPIPTVASPVTVDWGDMAAQVLANETTIIEATAEAGVSAGLSALPFGNILSMFIGPTVVKQYVDLALSAVESDLKSQAIAVPSGGIAAMVANMFTQNEPALAKFLGINLGPMIDAALAKLNITA